MATRRLTAEALDDESVGKRLARLRKERGLTQIELAERLGVIQSVLSRYERGVFRLNAELIVKLTQILNVTADEILNIEPVKESTGVHSRRLLRRIRQIDSLPKRDQQALMRTIDAFLAKSA